MARAITNMRFEFIMSDRSGGAIMKNNSLGYLLFSGIKVTNMPKGIFVFK